MFRVELKEDSLEGLLAWRDRWFKVLNRLRTQPQYQDQEDAFAEQFQKSRLLRRDW